jgi:hypothetical protein
MNVHDIHEKLSYHFTKELVEVQYLGVRVNLLSYKKVSHIAEHHLIYGTLWSPNSATVDLQSIMKLCHLNPINALKLF